MIKGNGVCKDVSIHLDGKLLVCEDLLPLGLGASDIILGVKWLETLGPVTTNWKTQIMQFEVGGSMVKLTRDPSLVRSRISFKGYVEEVTENRARFLD